LAPGLATERDVATFWRDGVVCLRDVMPLAWIHRMAGAVELALGSAATTDLTAMGDALGAAGAPLTVDPSARLASAPRGQFRAGTDHWVEQPAFLEFARDSPLPSIVARLLRSDQVWLYEDSVLVKEPGTVERTAFHQDLAYFHIDGGQVCTAWVPLDSVDTGNGAVQYLRGSHLDSTRFRPNLFVTTQSLPDTVGEEVPDYSGDSALVEFDTRPGDVVVHHARTIHGAHANRSRDRRRRAISVRYAGDDAVFRITPGAPQKVHHATLVEGAPLAEPACPMVWPVSPAGVAPRR
jgi:ectoine hydroxylase-related dioxygenase (phytanoyl-CoA dioxygenase family)